MKVSYSRVNKANINNVPITDGQIIYVKDTHDLYMDQGTQRLKVSDIIFLGTSEERVNLENPLTEKLYFVLEESSLYQYNGAWVSLSSKAENISFDNTDTTLTATNIQDAIVEINNKIGDISTVLDAINGEIIE